MTTTMEMLIGEEHLASRSDNWVEVVNPATEVVHATVPDADAQDVEAAVGVARRAFDTGPWSDMMPSERGKLLYGLADLIAKQKDEIALMDTEDMGKPYAHSRNHDLATCVDFAVFYAGLCDKVRGGQIPQGPTKHIYTIREPVGVVAGILPWNFPAVLAIQKLAPVLAYGNVIILKPAEQSPRSAIRIGELSLEAGIPPGVVNVITGNGEAGAALCSHPGVDKISFTGSTEVGKATMRPPAITYKRSPWNWAARRLISFGPMLTWTLRQLRPSSLVAIISGRSVRPVPDLLRTRLYTTISSRN